MSADTEVTIELTTLAKCLNTLSEIFSSFRTPESKIRASFGAHRLTATDEIRAQVVETQAKTKARAQVNPGAAAMVWAEMHERIEQLISGPVCQRDAGLGRILLGLSTSQESATAEIHRSLEGAPTRVDY